MDYLEEMIAAARGEVEVDLFLTGGNIANLLSGEVHKLTWPSIKAGSQASIAAVLAGPSTWMA